MLEELGLGIVLYLEDEFTPKANTALNSFERVQSGAEHMVESVEKNMLQMRNLMMTGFTFEQMGNSIENAGKRVMGVLEGFGRTFTKVNADYQTLQSQLLTSFKGNVQEAENAFNWIRDFSSKTPFEVQGLTDAFAKMKSTNMDLREQFKLTNGEVKTFAEAMGDLATRNMGATGGMTNMGYAIQNAWAGQAKSLYDRFNFSKQEMKGMMQYAGKDTHKFMEEFVKLSQRLAPDAMRNMGGTWQQTVSNMKDTWRNFLYDMGKTGVFRLINSCLNKLGDKMQKVFSDKKLVKSMGIALTGLVQPILHVVNGLANAVIWMAKFTAQHPKIARIALGFIGVSGVVLTLTGLIMKLSGGLLMAVSSMAILMMNFQLMSLTGLNLATMFAGLTSTILRVVSAMGVLSVVGAGLYLAWQSNVDGMQTKITNFFSSISTGWKLAKEAMKRGADLNGVMRDYQFKAKIKLPPLTKIFAGKFLKIIAITKAFWQVFTGHFNKGMMHFSKKDWNLYEKTGIAGLVRRMVYAKDKIDSFFNGFKSGLTVVEGVMKEFGHIILAPFKAVYDAVKKNIKQHPKGILASLAIGKQGVGLKEAERASLMAHRLGKALGIVVGAIASMKVIKWITPKLLSPFTKLYKKLGQIGKRAVNVKSKLENIASLGIGGVTSKVANKMADNSKHPKYWHRVGREIRGTIHDFDRTSRHPKGVGYSDGKFQTLNKNSVDPTYYNYFLKQRLGAGEQLQVKKRSKIGKLLFGETYYKKGIDGSREKLGKFGGLFRLGIDDRAIQRRATSAFRYVPSARENTVDGLTHRPVVGDTIGKLSNMKGFFNESNSKYIKRHYEAQNAVKTSAKSIKGLSNSQFDRFASVRQKELGIDFSNLRNQAQRGRFNSTQDALRYKEYLKLGVDDRNLQASEKIMHSSSSGRAILEGLKRNRANRALNNSVAHQETIRNARNSSINKTVYADNEAGAVRRMLFGQKLYTLNEDKKGNITRQVVGRRGGIFRRERSDMQYKPSKTWGQRLTQNRLVRRVANSRVASIVRPVSGLISRTAVATGRGFRFARGKVTNNVLTRGFSKAVGGVAGWFNKQRARVGLAPKVPGQKTSFFGAVRKAGGFLFGSKIRNAQGEVIGKRRGLIPRVGRGAMKVGRGLFRGAGLIGGMAMRAMPLMALGATAFRGLSARGAGVNRKKLGLSPKASNFQTGLKMMQLQLKKISFSKIWAKFRKEASGSFKIIKQIALDAFRKLKPELPKILGQAFEGIKAMAKLAWNWIQTDGITIMGQVASKIMVLLGKAFDWLSDNAGTIFEKIATFVIGTLIPKLIIGIVKLGIFIITHIPQILKILFKIAIGIFKGIYKGVKHIFKGVASFLWKTFKGALAGLKRVILGAIVAPIRGIPIIGDKVANALGLPAHHGGLWMSEDEHLAIIKKDETVLPPDKSRQLNSVLTNPMTKRSVPSAGGKTRIDNSINIKEVKVVVQAEKLSKSDARKQALMILDELKKIKREKQVRNYEDITNTGLVL